MKTLDKRMNSFIGELGGVPYNCKEVKHGVGRGSGIKKEMQLEKRQDESIRP